MPPDRGDVTVIAKKRPKKSLSGSKRNSADSGVTAARRKRYVRIAAASVLMLAGFIAAASGLTALTGHVTSMVMRRFPQAQWVFEDLPGELATFAGSDLGTRISNHLANDWMNAALCKAIADDLAASGWVERVNYVRRTSDARFRISCQYRVPFAMVQQDHSFYLIDRAGVRLPETYAYDESFMLIQGVESPPPEPGFNWPGDDLKAAISILARMKEEPFGDQLSAVLVQNFGGRKDARQCHIELATDRPGGRIRWGSAPGFEIDENKVLEKLAILRENYRETGRLDADHAVIDIVTFPDRYTIPG